MLNPNSNYALKQFRKKSQKKHSYLTDDDESNET